MEKFQIKNPPVFFVGIIILIVGIFIVIFDYPQIQYFENLESETFLLLEPEKQFIPFFDEKKTSTLGYKKGGSVVERNPYNYTAKAI